MQRTWLLILLLVPLAAAQPGPAPGYATAIDYAADHATSQAQNASDDPEGYAASKGSPGALHDEANHTAYMACWALDDADVRHEACDPYYTPRGQAQPDQPPCECNVSADDAVNATLNATETFVNGTVNETLAFLDDPEDPVGFLERLGDGVKRFVDALIGGVSAAGLAIIGALLFCLGLAGTALGGVVGAVSGLGQQVIGLVGDLGDLSSDGLQAGSQGLVAGILITVDGLVWMVVASGDGIAAAAKAIGTGVSAAAVAVWSGFLSTGATVWGGIGSAASTVGSGIADAAQNVGGAIADAAASVKDAVLDLFGKEPAGKDGLAPDVGAPVDVPDDDGLVDGLLGVLE